MSCPRWLLGPLFGAVADRWSRRGCMVVADLLRASAFIGLVLVDGFDPRCCWRCSPGWAPRLFTPGRARRRCRASSSRAGCRRPPRSTARSRTSASSPGPALAAAVLLVGGPETILAANGVSFVVSAPSCRAAAASARPAGAEASATRPSLLREAREGLVATAAAAQVCALVLIASAAALLLRRHLQRRASCCLPRTSSMPATRLLGARGGVSASASSAARCAARAEARCLRSSAAT